MFSCQYPLKNYPALPQDAIKCKSCESKFTAPNMYIQHHQSHHGGLPPEYLDKELFICDQCTHVFISKQSLSSHIINVHKEVDKSKRPKEKKCPYCAKLFRRQKNFQEHIIVKHEKSATHKCDQCSQSFGYLSKLHDHQKQVHQRVKCEDCGKDVCNAFMLKRHRATVHGIKPIDSHQCNQCPMFFTIRSSLDKHIAAKHPSL